MSNETCKWYRIKELIWQTGCEHQIGTPIEWEPVPGMACMCCKKPVEVVNDAGNESQSASAQDSE
jgi:hypothetical protein